MLQRAIGAGIPFAWVAADEAYGQVKHTRFWLEERGVAYVLATKVNDTVITAQGRESRVDALIAAQPRQRWKRLSGGAGARGERMYDWARVPIRYAWENGFGRWVLVRRSIADPSEIAYCVCFGPIASRLKDLVRVAAARWAVEECFQSAKGECGLDHYQVRLYRAWYRHITLAMAAHAYLTAVRAAEATKGGHLGRRARPHTPQPPGDPPVDGPRRRHAPLPQQRPPSALVTLPTAQPSPSPQIPLQTPRPHPADAVAVLATRDPEHPLAPYIPMFTEPARHSTSSVAEMHFAGTFPRFGRDNTEDALAASGITCPPVDARLIDTNLRFLKEAGFLHALHR